MYESTMKIKSKTTSGVTFRVRTVSYGARLELLRSVRNLAAKLEFHAASDKASDQLEAEILSREIKLIYLRWGLVDCEGLVVDGRRANVEDVINAGPEKLAAEIVAAVQHQLSLNRDEIKN